MNSNYAKETIFNMNKKIKNMNLLMIQWNRKVKQHLVQNLNEEKWAPRLLLGMGSFLHWCPPTPTLIIKEVKKLECGIKRIWFSR